MGRIVMMPQSNYGGYGDPWSHAFGLLGQAILQKSQQDNENKSLAEAYGQNFQSPQMTGGAPAVAGTQANIDNPQYNPNGLLPAQTLGADAIIPGGASAGGMNSYQPMTPDGNYQPTGAITASQQDPNNPDLAPATQGTPATTGAMPTPAQRDQQIQQQLGLMVRDAAKKGLNLNVMIPALKARALQESATFKDQYNQEQGRIAMDDYVASPSPMKAAYINKTFGIDVAKATQELRDKFSVMNNGGTNQMYSEYTGKPGQSFDKTASPDAVLSAQSRIQAAAMREANRGGGPGARSDNAATHNDIEMYKWASAYTLHPTGETDIYGKPVMTRVQNNPGLAAQLESKLGYGGGQPPAAPQTEDPRIAAARAAGYSEDEIQAFIAGGKPPVKANKPGDVINQEGIPFTSPF